MYDFVFFLRGKIFSVSSISLEGKIEGRMLNQDLILDVQVWGVSRGYMSEEVHRKRAGQGAEGPRKKALEGTGLVAGGARTRGALPFEAATPTTLGLEKR